MSKIYADGTSEVRTYNAFNQLSTITNAHGVMKSHSYDVARGLLLSESYSDETNNRTYLYNFLAMTVLISDDAEVRNFAYNSFNEIDTEEQCKLSCFVHPYLWLITWDPTQPVATRPLAIQKDGTWYAYGWDLTKNICEIFGQNGYIRSTYAYTPFGSITTSGDINQPIQWSSEYYDSELALVYYNYRHYNPTDGRWINRDPIAEQGGWNLYAFVGNSCNAIDFQGLEYEEFRLVWSPTNGKIGTVTGRYNEMTKQMEVLVQKYLVPSWYEWLTPTKKTSECVWRPATQKELNIYFSYKGNKIVVETDASVIFARSIGQVYNEIHVQEQIIAGNIILDIATVLLPIPKGLSASKTASTTKNSVPILRHFTSNTGYEGIWKSGILEGKGGVYASISKNGKISKFKHLLLLGIGDASKNIIIPQKLYNQFRTMYPIGPISALKFLGRTKYLPPGEINILTGKYIPYSGKTFIPWQYPADILIDAYVIWVNWYCDDEEN